MPQLRRGVSELCECPLNNCFAGTTTGIGFHSWVMLRDSLLVTLTVTMFPSDTWRREEAMPSH